MEMPMKQRDRDAIIQSLRAGVVPRSGHQHIQVGRAKEVKAVIGDLNRMADGGAAMRFIIGEYGSGKTFFMYLIRAIALQQKFVVANADLSPDRRLQGSDGRARSLYAELMRNVATRAKADGAALPAIVERFVSSARSEAQTGGCSTDDVIHQRLNHLSELVGGYDFAQVIAAYWRGYDTGNEQLQSDAIRWLRGEFSTRTDARQALGVRQIIDDASVYDHLKLFARFVRLAGFSGLLICLDEMVNLYKLANTTARNNNYEQLLRMLNDSLQGNSEGLGFILGGTPEFLTDARKGLYSYEALQSRLAENSFADEELQDLSGPVIRLASLTPEDLYLLLLKLRAVYASGNEEDCLLPDEALEQFMRHCSNHIGEAYFRTPRNTIKAFLDLLAILEQNSEASWTELIGGVNISREENPDLIPLFDDDEETAEGADGDELTALQL